MADPRTSYLDARTAYEDALAEFSSVIDPANRISSALAGTWDVEFGEMPEPKYQPLREVYSAPKQRKVIDLTKWPNAAQIEAGV
ncbi:MAG TPA: hypothetical protein VMR52_08795 [Dehalococcoidia bacterium]|nr:hypothetical protein [Dehalococcoidia bacterium]